MRFETTQISVSEGDGSVNILIVKEGPTNSTINVTFSTDDGTASGMMCCHGNHYSVQDEWADIRLCMVSNSKRVPTVYRVLYRRTWQLFLFFAEQHMTLIGVEDGLGMAI